MSVYLKLLKVREEIRKKELKRTEENTYSNYKYYQLSDFLPSITELCEKEKLFTIVNFNDDIATLIMIDAEKPDKEIVFSSPMGKAVMRGCHEAQNLGASQTYMRRYLYMNAFEIVDNDVLDENTGNEKVVDTKQKINLSDAQINRLFAIANSKRFNKEKVINAMIKKYKVKDLKELTKAQYDEACQGYENIKNGGNENV